MPSERAPFSFPFEAKWPFGSEDSLRRVARVAHWGSGARVLELKCGANPGGLIWAKEVGCALTCLETEDTLVDRLKERVKALGLNDRIDVRKADLPQSQFNEGQFDGIVSLGRVSMPLGETVKTLRRYLATKGRLCLLYPVRVGQAPSKLLGEHWQTRLGEPLMLPRECLQTLEREGYEPETVETLSDIELDDFYRGLEPLLPAGSEGNVCREEIELYRTAGGRGAFSYALVLGRRREPGEKPPVSRNE